MFVYHTMTQIKTFSVTGLKPDGVTAEELAWESRLLQKEQKVKKKTQSKSSASSTSSPPTLPLLTSLLISHGEQSNAIINFLLP